MLRSEGDKLRRIAIVGAHCSGKTTLVAGLVHELKKRGFVVDMVNEEARDCPLPVNKDTDFNSQSWVLAKIMQNVAWSDAHDHGDFVIHDRCVWDNYAYSVMGAEDGYILKHELEFLKSIAVFYSDIYDLVFLVQPLPMIDDGVRDTDEDWRDKVIDTMDDILMDEIDRKKLIRVPDDCGEEREDIIVKRLRFILMELVERGYMLRRKVMIDIDPVKKKVK
jgi:predicted ATPase